MARRWIRLDAEWEESDWLEALDGTAAGCWPRLLCKVKRDGFKGRCNRPTDAWLVRRWRVPLESVHALERAAIDDGALQIEDGEWVVVNWAEYQDHDPTAAERQRRYRASHPVTRDSHTPSHRDLSCATDTDTDTEGKNEKPLASLKKASNGEGADRRKRATALPEDWAPTDKHRELAVQLGVDIDMEADKLRDWARSKGEKCIDWNARFRNWLRNARPKVLPFKKPAPQQYDYSDAKNTEFKGFTA